MVQATFEMPVPGPDQKYINFDLICIGDPTKSNEYAEAIREALVKAGLEPIAFTINSVGP